MKNKAEAETPNAIITDLIPRGKSLYVKPISLNPITKSNIIISESTKTPKPTAIIWAVGPDCKDDLKNGIGKIVMHNPFSNLTVIDRYNNILLFMEDMDIRSFIDETTVVMDASDEKIARIDIEK